MIKTMIIKHTRADYSSIRTRVETWPGHCNVRSAHTKQDRRILCECGRDLAGVISMRLANCMSAGFGLTGE